MPSRAVWYIVTEMMPNLARILLGGAILVLGLYLFMFGGSWAPVALEVLPDTDLGVWLELVVPFLPMLLVGGGVLILTLRNPPPPQA